MQFTQQYPPQSQYPSYQPPVSQVPNYQHPTPQIPPSNSYDTQNPSNYAPQPLPSHQQPVGQGYQHDGGNFPPHGAQYSDPNASQYHQPPAHQYGQPSTSYNMPAPAGQQYQQYGGDAPSTYQPESYNGYGGANGGSYDPSQAHMQPQHQQQPQQANPAPSPFGVVIKRAPRQRVQVNSGDEDLPRVDYSDLDYRTMDFSYANKR